MARLGTNALGDMRLGTKPLGTNELGTNDLLGHHYKYYSREKELQQEHIKRRTEKHIDEVEISDVFWLKDRYGIDANEIEDDENEAIDNYDYDYWEELRLHQYDYYSKDYRISISDLKKKYRNIYIEDYIPDWNTMEDETNVWLDYQHKKPEYEYFDLQDFYQYYPKNRGFLGAKFRRVANKVGAEFSAGPSNYLYSEDNTFQSMISVVAVNWRDSDFKNAFNSLSDGELCNIYFKAKSLSEDVYELLLEKVLQKDENLAFSISDERFHNRVLDTYDNLRDKKDFVSYSDIVNRIR